MILTILRPYFDENFKFKKNGTKKDQDLKAKHTIKTSLENIIKDV